MSTVAFNSVSGYTVGENPAKSIILANGDITTINFTANGVSNLGPIANVKITGGTSGQAITTDGSGNLTFTTVSGSSNLAAPMPYYIATASSYSVSANFQGLFATPITIDGTLAIDGILIDVSNAMNSLDQQVLFDSNAVVTGNVGFTFNSTSGNLAVPGSISTTTGNYLILDGATGGTRISRNGSLNGLDLQTGSTSRLFIYDTGNVNITSTTATTSNAAGALTVQGGVGVAGSMYVGNRVGYTYSNSVSAAYTVFNAATSSIDTVFG